GLDDDPPRPVPPGGIPLPATTIPGEGEPGAPTTGVEPPASLSGRTADPVWVAACLADRGLDLLHEGPEARGGTSGMALLAAEVTAEVVVGIAGHLEATWSALSESQVITASAPRYGAGMLAQARKRRCC